MDKLKPFAERVAREVESSTLFQRIQGHVVLIGVGIALLALFRWHQQLEAMFGKTVLLSTAILLAYWASRRLFPYFRPNELLQEFFRLTAAEKHAQAWPYCVMTCTAVMARVVLIGFVVVAYSLGA
jgi:hypothetical protein